MEDTLLIDAAERFAKGEMSAEEQVYFEDLRKNNPELDQAVVEQLFFLNQLDAYSGNKNFRSALGDVELKLAAEKFVTRSAPKQQGKILMLWSRYRKTIAVAASIAGIVSLAIATLVSSVNSDKNTDVKQLIGKINDLENKTATQENKINKQENKLNQIAATAVLPARLPIQSHFRATGFMIDVSNNYLVTNAHVLREFPHNLIIENNNGEQFYAAPVYINTVTDIAIVKITDSAFKRLPALPYTIRKTGAELGESIFMLGYPKQEVVYGEGYISAKNGYLMDTVYCQLSTSANEGNSGSPVVTKNGDLVGILTSTELNASGVVFAIKSANIFRAIEEAKKTPGIESIKITSAPALKGLDRPGQIKKMEDYVFMVKGN